MAKRKGVYARDIDRLNLIFAAVAIGCMLSVFWMIWDDYAREWKRYQRQFQVIEQEVTQQEIDSEQASIDQVRLAQFTQQRDAAEQQLAAQQDQLDALESQTAEIEVRLFLATQESRFARSIYDSVRYFYEEAEHDPNRDASRELERLQVAQAQSDETNAALEDVTTESLEIQAQLDTLRQALTDADAGLGDMNREINRLNDLLNSLRFGFAWTVRNAPMLDALNPSLRIRQAVMADLTMDLNFAEAPRVDRCQSCHLGAANEAYADQSQPFTSHPRLDLFVADSSVHPAGEFGCTVCHLGKGRATSFYSAIHTPANESEAHRWEEELGWAPIELWDWPMRPLDETEASCLKCHIDNTWVPDADELQYGLDMIENLGCYGCHQLDRFDEQRNTGPSLKHVGVKTTPEWAYNWVMDPKSFRPNTPMPKFFNLANTSDAYWTERNKVEVDAIVAYVFNSSTDVELDTAPSGDPARGQALINSVGCLGCHIVDAPGSADFPDDEPRFTGYRQQGPNLWGIGSKVSADWLYTWVQNPEHYFPDTVMPNLRLTEREAADATAFLMSLTNPAWDSPTIPSVDADLRHEVALEYLKNTRTTVDAEAELAAMDDETTRLYLGNQLIGRYGCYSCHVIPGFEDRGRIGTSLSDWGSKPIPRLDFGLLDLPHERRAFLEQKLEAPRSYDDGKIKAPQEKARMPNYGLTPGEVAALTTAILGYTDEVIPDVKKPAQTPRLVAMEAGRSLIHKYNCRACHIIEGKGGAIQAPIIALGVAAGQDRAVAAAYAPPNLNTEGAKTQPEWLYNFLYDPSTPIRPWLDVHMPTFGFNDEELNTLTQYFSAVDAAAYPFDQKFTLVHEYPRDMVSAGRGLAEGQLQCFRCHVQGSVNPPGTEDNWAPDLALAADRLRFEWIQDWIADPQSVFPGTKMPQYWQDLEAPSFMPEFDADARLQIEALAAYIMSLGQ